MSIQSTDKKQCIVDATMELELTDEHREAAVQTCWDGLKAS
ncbi:MAG: hypothetical protein QNJ46_29175 [Leptolyngbyaceae cyanobacterium MO_188.B28]|nr:hypothetical protein [Leptolyngbyaceae cyanobacterium MO_188.B28]